MKKAMKQLFQKGISGILCAAMILTSLSIPEMTAYAAETEITDETETADKTNDGITNESDVQDTDSEAAKESEDISETDNKDQDSDSDADKEDANSEAGGGDLADDTVDDLDEAAPEADKDVVGVADVDLDVRSVDRVVTFHYYVGDVDENEEVGVITWTSGISFLDEEGNTATEAGWHPWDKDVNIAYTMTPDSDYAGWYSIKIGFENELGNNPDFQIIKKSTLSDAEFNRGLGKDTWELFDEIVGGTETSYAVKAAEGTTAENPVFNLYKGDSAVAAIKRNVTLYVYSEDGVPAFMSESKLQYVDEDAGSEEELDKVSFTDSGTYEDEESGETKTWYNYYYNMEEETNQDNWYKLTFIAPSNGTGAYKIGSLYTYKKAEETPEGTEEIPAKADYKWKADFYNGKWDNMEATKIDFTPVFKGDVYFKDDAFSSSRSVALSALNALITEANTKKTAGQGKYTDTTWKAFTDALTDAVTLADGLGNIADNTVTDEQAAKITDAYNELDKAMKGLKEEGRIVTFNYYAGDVDDGDEVGIITWDAAISFLDEDGNAATAATTWHPWGQTGNIAYIMTPDDDYPGWYSIKIEFGNGWKTTSDIQILKKKTPSDSEFKYTGNDLKAIGEGTETSYAVKAGEGGTAEAPKFNLYKGDSEVTAIKRNVTLYVYSDDGVPAFMTLGSPLKKIDEADGSEEPLTMACEDEGTTWHNYYYNFEKEDGQDNWYELTFTVPYQDVKWVYEVGQLHTYKKDGETPAASDYTRVVQLYNGAPDWSGVTATQIDFTPVFKGDVYFKDGAFSNSRSVALSALNALITEANTIKTAGQGKYTDATWEAFTNALTDANNVVYVVGTKEDNAVTDKEAAEITAAYNILDAAMKGLKEEGRKTTFNYYVGDIGNDEEIGIYQWGGLSFYYEVEDEDGTTEEIEATAADWKPWGDQTAYLMTPNDQYAGWYSITVKVEDSLNKNANFEIFRSTNTSTSMIKCGQGDNNVNNDIFSELTAGNGTVCAVKAYGTGNNLTNKLYKGADDVNAAMRNVKLYVYSEDTVPAIGSKTELSTINAGGKVVAIDASNTGTDINYYNMTKDTENEGWYYLTFSAPVPAEDSNEICGLYTLSGTTYTLAQTFLDGEPSTGVTGSVNFNKVFSGSVYYNDGQFYESMELALGITLKMLKDYVDSEAVKAVENNGQTYYTEATWTAFSEAKDAAEKLIESLGDTAEDDSKSPAITAAYSALKKAVEGMKKQEPTVTFYYYNDSIAEDEELGLTFGGNDKSYSTAELYENWHVWNEAGDAYKMTAVEGYPGWYTIPIVFVSEGTTYEWCRISSHKQGDPADTTKEVQVYDKDYPKLNGATVYAYKSKYYVGEELVNLLMRNVALYVYDETTTPTVETVNKITGYVDESTGKKVTIADTEAVDGVYHYNMALTEDTGWYSLKFAAPQAGDNKEIGRVSGGTGSGLPLTFIEGATTEPNSVDLTQYFGKSLYYKNGHFYDVRPYTVEELKALIEEAVKLRDDDLAAEEDGKNDYYHDSKDDGGKWDIFVSKIGAANTVAENADSTDDEIRTAYDELRAAMKELVHVPQASESISVKQVALADDFITGADLSSYVSLKESGTIFKDENGKALSDQEFFDMLYEGGTNWVRIRVWNDPYNSNGNGYGGGNSDLDKAKTIGKWATNAGMKVLIDFHYSDFWADPSKQDTPKAWKGYDIEQKEDAVYHYTLDSLNELAEAGVAVGMVQIGNETNNAICGENNWTNMAKIFNAGSRAVREFSKDCLVAVHFADPSSTAFSGYAAKLDSNNVDYDVFAASYYPFWHGGLDKLSKLQDIAKTYNKKVMVAETSWVTTWEDGDGHGNTSPKTTQTLPYPVSVQGQADEMRAVINAVNSINNELDENPAIGVFYWEPAWISPNYVYNGDSKDQNLYNKNKELWEKYGSGWASSYAAEYDPTDAGLWYGGSAVDNQAWFDFNGKAIETYKTYSYIRTGAVASDRKNSISSVQKEIELKLNVGENKSNIKWPNGNYQYDDKGELTNADEEVVITFSDGTKASDDKSKTHYKSIEIKWDEDQQALVNTDRAAVYTVDGVVKCEYYTTVKDPDTEPLTSVETYDVTLIIEVLSTGNILENPGFENDLASWKTDGSGINTLDKFSENPRSDKKAMAFWDDKPFNFTIEQTVTDIKPGTYTAGGFIEGNGASAKDVQTLYVIVTDSANKSTKYEATCSLNGWLNWANPEISNVKVSQGDKITVGMEIQSSVAEAWGSIDDMYLYGKYGLNLGDIKNGVVNVSNMEADSGEVVRIAAMPENGYYLSKLELTGETVTKDILKDESGLGKAPEDATADDKKSVLIYNGTGDKSDATMQAYFVMPEGTVTLNAEFTQIPLSSVSMDNVVAKDFELTGEKYIYKYTQEYTGKKIELDLDLSYMGYKLTNADYTAKYKNNVNKTTGDNMAEITVTAKGKKFTGKKTLYFSIDDTKVDISKAKAVLTDDDPNKVDTYYYTGAEIEPLLTGLTDKSGQPLKNKDGSGNLTVSAEDYKIYYQKNIKVGKATMTVIANNNENSKIKGSFTQTFTIAKRPIVDNSGNLANGITIVAPTGSTYTGSKITPNVTVKYGSKELQKGRDYTVSYKNNVNVSKGAADNKKPSLKITGKGNYTGATKEYYFEISAKSISDYGMKAEAEAIAENKAPKITLKNGTKKLSLNKHYRITEILRKANGDKAAETIYECDPETGNVKKGTKPNAAIKDAGEYTVTLNGIEKGGYTGTQTVDFNVIDKEHLISAAKVTIKCKSLPYTGSEITLGKDDIEVKNSKGGTLTFGDDYTLSYNDVDGNKTNIKVGKATVTITGKGVYAGTKTAKFTIAKRAVVDGNAAGTATDKAAITYEVKADTLLDKIYKKTADGSKLELPYTGFAWTPELDIYATNGGAKKLLTKGTDYTISYKNNLKPGSEASITIKGKGNYSGSVKFDKVFTVKDVTLDDFVITINPVEYNGKALKPAINFVYKETGTVVNMKAGTAYAVKYTNNKNVASIESTTKPTVTITEKGLNAKKKGTAKGKVELPFTITTARITAASVSEVKIQTYNGKPSKPALTIKVNGKKLKAGTDYVVTYSGNSRPNDKATARIIGIGNYSGTVNKTFVIK